MLSKIDNSFIDSQIKTKVQLYILPLLLIYFVFYFINTKEIEKTVSKPIKINFSNKKYKGDFLELFRLIEKKAKLVNIDILYLYNKKKTVYIKGKGSVSNLRKLVNKLESINNFTNLNLLKIKKIEKSNSYEFEINLTLDKYFIKRKTSKEEVIVKKDFKLKAIIGKYAFIDDKLIKIDEVIEDYKLVEIQKNYIKLKRDKEILKLKLINDRFTKHIN